MAELEAYEGTATIEKVAALAAAAASSTRRSDIYGGLGSSFDYGHYGVLLKQNVKAEWQRSMVQEREDIVLLDSAIILHPQVWVASGHVGGFSDPLVDCRTCKLRFRADHLDSSACGRRPSKHPGETPDCDLTEARQFNLMFETSIGPVRDEGSLAYLRPETAQGIFVNFKNVTSSLRVKPPFGIAQIGKSFRNEITPGNFLFRTREFEQMEMEFFVPPAEAQPLVRVLDRRAPPLVPRPRPAREPPARPRARRRRALALLERHERPRVPLPDRLVGARGDREPRRLRPQRARRGSRARSSSGSATRSATSRT